ncbi:MAG: DUF4338 domain-containing protein [Deltaproteobacteria bacterium]|jgi:hypothetical protein|nr:DUF4338 domain-containing protein [Deltaproteobacteria bacterium]
MPGVPEGWRELSHMNKEWLEKFDMDPLGGELSDYREPVLLHKVDETRREPVWNKLVNEYHYLGYETQIGCRVKYIMTMGTHLIGAMSFCSGAYQLSMRDQFIGWDEKTRLEYLPHLLNNNRFLIFPWIKVRNLASHLLSGSLKRVQEDWVRQYEVEPYLVETFVDRSLYLGTSYVAANWVHLGTTKGFGRIGKDYVFHGREKDLYVYILSRRFRNKFKPDVGRVTNDKTEIAKLMAAAPMKIPPLLEKAGVTDIEPGTLAKALGLHLEKFSPYLGRKEHLPHMVSIVRWLLMDQVRKFGWWTADGKDTESLSPYYSSFLSKSLFDHESMLDNYQRELGKELSHPAGMICGDRCDFQKFGERAAGVSRQPFGPDGREENCQASVMVGYASLEGRGLADCALVMPEEWFGGDFKEKREQCRVPEDLKFEPKDQILLRMISRTVTSGCFAAKYVSVESEFGDDPEFLASLPSELTYFAEVSGDRKVFITSQPDPETGGAGSMEVFQASVRGLVDNMDVPWNDLSDVLGASVYGIRMDKCIPVVESSDGGRTGTPVWLYVMLMEDGQIRCALCNEAVDATPEMLRSPAMLRLSYNGIFSEARTYLGLDHYEVRSWSGWKRHMIFVFIAQLFITKVERQYFGETGDS